VSVGGYRGKSFFVFSKKFADLDRNCPYCQLSATVDFALCDRIDGYC
jgi:hypothetical protein